MTTSMSKRILSTDSDVSPYLIVILRDNMKTEFKFSNLLGTVYCKGNILFTPDGSSLLSPVGNRITTFNLLKNESFTLPFTHRRNISRIALTERGNLLLSIDEDGRGILVNFPHRVVLSHLSFNGSVSALAFSPSGRYFAVGFGRTVQVWFTPLVPSSGSDDGPEFAPFVLHREYPGHYDSVQSIEWSNDDSFFLSASKDLTARVWSVDTAQKGFHTTLAGHKEGLIGAWFSSGQHEIYTVSHDGALFRWTYSSESSSVDFVDSAGDKKQSQQWRIAQRHYFMQINAKVRCAKYHAKTKLLVVGFSNGLFNLYELPAFNMIHTLSISQNDIDHVSMNESGEWLAFASSRLGQLLVWEWQSESYILKQQGHFDSLNALTYSPDGQRIITAADDGKIKVWDTQSSFCIVTFTEHTSGVTACEFAKKGNVLFTSSLDGSVRAWDLIRYRNFRTFTAPTRLSFSSLAVDPSGEVICAASLDSFDIHIWSVQTGQLLDRLAGHEGPISALAFAPSTGVLVSGSWDQTVRVWSIFDRRQTSEALQLQADILHVAIRPDSKQAAIATLDGQLTFWSLVTASQETVVDGSQDISGGRKLTDRRTAANAPGTKFFSSLAYSTDGSCIIAGGRSKYMCLYDVWSSVLIKKFVVSVNLSFDGTQEFLNNRNLIEGGAAGTIDEQGEESDLEARIDHTMPGSRRGDMSTRRTVPEVNVSAIAFSPTGRSFCAASTEGLLLYSLDTTVQFDPFDLDLDITPNNTVKAFAQNDFLQALLMSFRLNDPALTRSIYENIPLRSAPLIIHHLPPLYIPALLGVLARASTERPHFELNLRWIEMCLREHGAYIKLNLAALKPQLRDVQKAVDIMGTGLARLMDDNAFQLEYLLTQPRGKKDDVDVMGE